MPYCVFRWCKNYSCKIKKDEGVTYHTFPRDGLMRDKWIRSVQAERSDNYWMPTKNSTICSAHFNKGDKYSTSKGYSRLKKSAVPVPIPDEVKEPASPTKFEEINESDTESVLDSPVTAILKSRVHKLTVEKQILRKNNRVLKKQNWRLKTKITTMKDMMKVLKKKTKLLEQQLAKLNPKGT